MEDNTSKAYATPGPMSPLAPANGAGSALFVINLCASIAPVQTAGKNLPGLDNYRLYQVSRVEDGRTRHRLRLGFFTSEAHAESVLTVVRQQYPTAFTSCLGDEDRKFARGYLPESAPAPKPTMVVVQGTVAPKPAAEQPKTVAKPQQPAPAATQSKSAQVAAKAKPAAPAVAKAPATPPAPPAAAKAQTAAANVASKPPQPARSPEDVLAELTWDPPPLLPPAADSGKSTSDTAKHPVLSAGFKTQPVIKAKPAPITPAAAKPAPKTDTAASMRVPALQLTLEDPPPPHAPEQHATTPAQPFHVGKGVEIGDVGISLQAEPAPVSKVEPAPAVNPTAAAKPSTPARAAAVKQAAAAPAKPAARAPKTPTPLQAKAAPTKPAAVPRPQIQDLPELDSTQTIRALTNAELSDDSQEKWFAIQLTVSDQPVNLEAMPRLDIFEAYRLYSVATAGSGKIVHSLRLGFFKEAVSAEAVSGYLKTFFGSPSVLRISVAEQARFKDPPVRKAPPESKPGKVVELNARAARPVVPTVTMEVDTSATGCFKPNATGSFQAGATGSFKPNATGSFQASASGTHKMLKPAAKSGAPAVKHGTAASKTGTTGKHRVAKKSLSEQLLDEAREVELSESGVRKLPKNNSLLSRLVGKLTK